MTGRWEPELSFARHWAAHACATVRDATRGQLTIHLKADQSPALVCGTGDAPTTASLDADSLLSVRLDAVVASRYRWPSVFSGSKVAEGSWDADLHSGGSAHDAAAVCLLVREAGGTVSDRDGGEQRYDRPLNGCLLSNGRVHARLLEAWTRRHRRADRLLHHPRPALLRSSSGRRAAASPASSPRSGRRLPRHPARTPPGRRGRRGRTPAPSPARGPATGRATSGGTWDRR